MILYTVKNGVYYNLEDFKEDLSDLGENGFPNKIYINMTNRCSCSCTFCLRSLKEFNEHNSLWLKEEPSVELVKELFSKYKECMFRSQSIHIPRRPNRSTTLEH